MRDRPTHAGPKAAAGRACWNDRPGGLGKVPASYRTLISQGWVHYCDCGYNSGGCEKLPPLSFGTVKSRLWEVLDAGHYEVKLSEAELRAVKCWTDLNCPLWPDYMDRTLRPGPERQAGLTTKPAPRSE